VRNISETKRVSVRRFACTCVFIAFTLLFSTRRVLRYRDTFGLTSYSTILRHSSLAVALKTTRSFLFAHTRRHAVGGSSATLPMPLEAVSPWPSWRSLLRLAPEPFLTTRREPRQPESLIAEPAQVFGYPFHKSTAEVYRSETKEFRPQYARVRGTLDYTYHFSPTLARQRVQDRIIEEALSKGEASDEPWLLFTAGGMGAGKSWSMKRLSLKGYFRQTSFVRVDPDDLRTHLPEYSRYLLHDAMTAGQKTHEVVSPLCAIFASHPKV